MCFFFDEGNQCTYSKSKGIFLKVSFLGNHIKNVAKNLTKNIYVLRNIARGVSVEVLGTSYYVIFHSHIMYAIIVWEHLVEVQRVSHLHEEYFT